jgi:hypothetical protein
VVCQVCGAKSGVYPLCAVDYKKYKKGVLVKCPTCSMFHLKEDDCPRCNRSLLLDDLLIKRNEMKYWGTKLFAIAKGGKQQNPEGHDIRRYESVIQISTELQPLWADLEKPIATVSKKEMFAWSESLKNTANEGIQQSDDDSDISRYLAVRQLSEEIQGETVSYFGKLESTTDTRPTVADEEFVTDRDIVKRLVKMLDRAEKVIRIASP